MKVDWESRFESALRDIAAYMTPEQHRRQSERRYGLDAAESMEMALDNILGTAKAALKGYKRKPLPAPPTSGAAHETKT